jgi:hypothetical protein
MTSIVLIHVTYLRRGFVACATKRASGFKTQSYHNPLWPDVLLITHVSSTLCR